MRLSNYLITEHIDDSIFIHSGVDGSFNQIPADLWRRAEAFCAGTDDGDGIFDKLETMVRANILVADEVDELDVLERRYLQSRHGGGLGLTIVTSLGCNFDCPYCFESKRPSLLKADVQQAVLGMLDDGLAAGTPSVNIMWMGGEPLLGADQLLALSQQFIDRCDAAEVGYTASITTNGWYLTGSMAAKLAEMRVTAAQVTIDGPADVHDHYRPTKSGKSSFDRLIDNICEAVEHLRINVRVNIDEDNFGRVEELMEILAARGLAGKISLTPARLSTISSAEDAPAQTYEAGCYGCSSFGAVELEFEELARRHGFEDRKLPGRVGSPCTAVRSTELVVGSDGELWKCWDDIGNPEEMIGTIFDYKSSNEHMLKWLQYSPFQDDQCRTCVALPGCMGGCVHHTFFGTREDQCLTFRFNHREKVRKAALTAAGKPIPGTGLTQFSLSQQRSPLVTRDVAIQLSPRRKDPVTALAAATNSR